MPKKIRRRRKYKKLLQQENLKKDLEASISLNKDIVDKKERDFYLSNEDRIRWVMEFSKKGLERVTISYEIEINKEWLTIKMYDNAHSPDYLHRHTKESLKNRQEIISTDHVIERGGPSEWLNWARKDIFKNWYYYRRAFLKRSKLVDNE